MEGRCSFIDDQVQTDSCRLVIFPENVERWFAISRFIFWFHSFARLPQQTKSSKPALTKLTRRLQPKRHSPEFWGCRVPNFQVRSIYFIIAQFGLIGASPAYVPAFTRVWKRQNVFKKKGCGSGPKSKKGRCPEGRYNARAAKRRNDQRY